MSQSKPLTYGINKCYYAVKTVSGSTVSYGTPKRLIGARQLSINAEGTNEKFYADNGVYFITDTNSGKSGSLEVVGLNDTSLADLFGYVTDANGIVLEDADAKSANVALLFECENDGDYPTRFSMFDVKFTRPTEEHNTKEDSATPDTVTMDYEAAPCELPWGTGATKRFVGGHIDRTTETATTYDGWYTAVKLPTAPTGTTGASA